MNVKQIFMILFGLLFLTGCTQVTITPITDDELDIEIDVNPDIEIEPRPDMDDDLEYEVVNSGSEVLTLDVYDGKKYSLDFERNNFKFEIMEITNDYVKLGDESGWTNVYVGKNQFYNDLIINLKSVSSDLDYAVVDMVPRCDYEVDNSNQGRINTYSLRGGNDFTKLQSLDQCLDLFEEKFEKVSELGCSIALERVSKISVVFGSEIFETEVIICPDADKKLELSDLKFEKGILTFQSNMVYHRYFLNVELVENDDSKSTCNLGYGVPLREGFNTINLNQNTNCDFESGEKYEFNIKSSEDSGKDFSENFVLTNVVFNDQEFEVVDGGSKPIILDVKEGESYELKFDGNSFKFYVNDVDNGDNHIALKTTSYVSNVYLGNRHSVESLDVRIIEFDDDSETAMVEFSPSCVYKVDPAQWGQMNRYTLMSNYFGQVESLDQCVDLFEDKFDRVEELACSIALESDAKVDVYWGQEIFETEFIDCPDADLDLKLSDMEFENGVLSFDSNMDYHRYTINFKITNLDDDSFDCGLGHGIPLREGYNTVDFNMFTQCDFIAGDNYEFDINAGENGFSKVIDLINVGSSTSSGGSSPTTGSSGGDSSSSSDDFSVDVKVVDANSQLVRLTLSDGDVYKLKFIGFDFEFSVVEFSEDYVTLKYGDFEFDVDFESGANFMGVRMDVVEKLSNVDSLVVEFKYN